MTGARAGSRARWDPRTHWALNAVKLPGQDLPGRTRRGIVAPCTSRGLRITVADIHRPYGRSVHASGYLTHIVAGVLLVWDRGVFRAAQARWRCGARTLHFRLLDEPDSTVCPACTIERTGRPGWEHAGQ